MIEKLIEIGIKKAGNKRQLGIALGYDKKYASQRVNKIIENQNITMATFKKLLDLAGLKEYLEVAITAEHKKIKDI